MLRKMCVLARAWFAYRSDPPSPFPSSSDPSPVGSGLWSRVLAGAAYAQTNCKQAINCRGNGRSFVWSVGWLVGRSVDVRACVFLYISIYIYIYVCV